MNEVYEFRSCFALGNQARSPYSNSVTLGFNKSSQAYIIKMQVNSRYMSVNGQTLEVDPGFATAPTIINSRTMVPIRAVVEAMGGVAGWDEETRQVTLDANGVAVVMFIGSTSYYVSGHPLTMDTAPVIKDGRTLIPARLAAEALGCGVGWNPDTQEITITFDPNGQPAA